MTRYSAVPVREHGDLSVMIQRTITGRHVLYGFVCFFGVILVANAIFIYLAVDTFTGLSTERPYQRGIAYNETLEARSAQRALGWRAKVSFDEARDGQGVLTVAMRDRAGAPLEDLRVAGQIRRPTHEGLDQDLTLVRSGIGAYSVELILPRRGQWDLRLTAESRDGARFEMEHRIWLK